MSPTLTLRLPLLKTPDHALGEKNPAGKRDAGIGGFRDRPDRDPSHEGGDPQDEGRWGSGGLGTRWTPPGPHGPPWPVAWTPSPGKGKGQALRAAPLLTSRPRSVHFGSSHMERITDSTRPTALCAVLRGTLLCPCLTQSGHSDDSEGGWAPEPHDPLGRDIPLGERCLAW